MAVHSLLAEHTVAETQRLQIALGRIRRASGDFIEKLLAIAPHRIQSYSKRQFAVTVMTRGLVRSKWRRRFSSSDPDTHQPVCFTTATSA